MNAKAVQRASGKGRDPWDIRRELAIRGRKIVDVARMADTYHNVVSDTIRGMRNHGRTLKVLEEMGVPMHLLYPEQAETLGKAA